MNAPQYLADHSILTANDDGLRNAPPRALVVHTSEGNPDLSADDLAIYQLQPAAGGSYHVIIDRTGRMVRSNDDAYIPWAAAWTGNRVGLHVCLVGRAGFNRDEWLARRAQLDRLADWLRYNSTVYGIPLRLVDAAGLRGAGKGVCGHDTVRDAWGETDHWDPGPAFPYDRVLGGTPTPTNPTTHIVQPGETLTAIAKRYGTTVGALTQINRLRDPNLIRIGHVLRLKVR